MYVVVLSLLIHQSYFKKRKRKIKRVLCTMEVSRFYFYFFIVFVFIVTKFIYYFKIKNKIFLGEVSCSK